MNMPQEAYHAFEWRSVTGDLVTLEPVALTAERGYAVVRVRSDEAGTILESRLVVAAPVDVGSGNRVREVGRR